MEEPRPEVRIGDRERRATDAHLQQAHGDGVLLLTEYDERAAQCWAARTQSDLDALVRDLPPYRPVQETGQLTVPAPASEDKPAEPGKKKKKKQESLGERIAGTAFAALALGAGLFFGGHVITSDDAVAVFGSRDVAVVPGQERVEVGAAFGNVKVTVPEGMRAQIEGRSALGSVNCTTACEGTGQQVLVDATSIFGSVDVVRPGQLTDDEIEDQQDAAEEAAEDAREAIEDATDD